MALQRERAETNAALISSFQLTPNEARLLEDRDTIEGADFLSGPANGAIFDPSTGEFFIPGQLAPGADADAPEPVTTPFPADPTPKAPDAASAKPSKATARLQALAQSMADRVCRKELKTAPDAKFVADVLNVSIEVAETYVTNRKAMTDEQAREALVALAIGDTHD